MAAHEGPATPLPCVLAGEEVHDDEAETAGGRGLYALSVELMRLDTLRQADWWVERYLQWCEFWADFLEDVSVVDGRRQFTHERLRRARSSLSRLVSQETPFTYLDPALTAEVCFVN